MGPEAWKYINIRLADLGSCRGIERLRQQRGWTLTTLQERSVSGEADAEEKTVERSDEDPIGCPLKGQ